VAIKRIDKSDPEYPSTLHRFLAEDAPDFAAAFGNLQILTHPKLAIFCSGKCPGVLVSQTKQVMQKVVDARVTVISGFHSEVEKECLSILLHGRQPIILSPARGLEKLRIRPEFKEPLENGRLLFLSFFKSHRHRSDIEMALKRNRYVAALADKILTIHAAPSSKTEQLCRDLISWRKSVFTMENEANQNLVRLGAQTIVTHGELVSGLTAKDTGLHGQ
jgi:predicted Rossmann fold nucleotide-binding protein DprA/Smf involved in DNA uptake